MDFPLTDEDLLSTAQIDAALHHQRTKRGSALRVLEIALSEQEINQVWAKAAQRMGRQFYHKGYQLMTLEEAYRSPSGEISPILSRQIALSHLILAQRQEGPKLHLLTVNPFFDEEPTEIKIRAKEINVFGIGQLHFSVIPPKLFRQCMDFAYPPAIYGDMDMYESLALEGLVSLRDLLGYSDLNQAVKDGLVREQDYINAVSRLKQLPTYDGRPPTLDHSIIPRSLEEQQVLYSHSIDEGGRLVILATSPPPTNLITQLRRLAAREVTFELTTKEFIQTLRSKYASYRSQDDSENL